METCRNLDFFFVFCAELAGGVTKIDDTVHMISVGVEICANYLPVAGKDLVCEG